MTDKRITLKLIVTRNSQLAGLRLQKLAMQGYTCNYAHREAAATYAEGQRWETAIDTNAQTGEKIINPIWTPVNDQPLWDKYQAYRRVA